MIAKTKTAWSQHLTWEYANTRTQGFHPSCAPQLGNQEVMFLSRIILPWWRHHVTCPRDRSRIVTLTVVLPRYTYYSSQLSTHSEYNLGSKCVCRCERSRFPRCSQTTIWEPAASLQLCCRTTPGHQLVLQSAACSVAIVELSPLHILSPQLRSSAAKNPSPPQLVPRSLASITMYRHTNTNTGQENVGIPSPSAAYLSRAEYCWSLTGTDRW